ESQHAKNGEGGSAENRQFKGHRNESGPTVQWAPSDIQRIGENVRPILKAKSCEPAAQSAEQREIRHPGTLKAQRFREALDRERRVGIDVAIARLASFFGGVDQLLRRFKLTHHAVNVRALLVHS